jgi:hypothetical protein
MKQQHHPIDVKTHEKGINCDSNKEILGSSNGEHVDALNMRSLPMDGNNSAKKKIKGEVVKFPNIDNRCIGGTGQPLSNTYECMLTMEVQGHIIEVWASPDWNVNDPDVLPPLMRVDGKIVMMSGKLPFYTSFPLQYDKNANCVGGELYITNNLTPPLVFSLKDLMENSGIAYSVNTNPVCTQKYFDEFNIVEYTVNITANLNKPQFIRQDPADTLQVYDRVFGATGVPVGYYSYSYRFVTLQGDRTSWSPLTEMIPVVENVASGDSFFPNRQTFSNFPNVTSGSGYGNHLKIRVENYNNFDSIEIRRDSFNAGLGIGTAPISEIIGLLLVQYGTYVVDILDRCNSNEVEEPLTLNEQTNNLTSIQRAKAIRYYNNRLYLMNIGYASKDIDDVVEFNVGADLVKPTIQNMKKGGHKDVYNATFYKSNMRGDSAGAGIVLFDSEGNMSYAKKIDGAESINFPNRRDRVDDALTIETSYYGMVKAGRVDGTVGFCHEVFDHIDAVTRSSDLVGNIRQEPAPIPPQDLAPFAVPTWDYLPLYPTSANDSRSSYGGRANVRVCLTQGQADPIDSRANTDSGLNYDPKCYGLNYYSMGIAFAGIQTFPEWASGFSVVQTHSTKKVMAQGLGWYDMKKAEKGRFGENATKNVNAIWVYFPDFDQDTGIYASLANELINNFSNYKIQLTAPLGFFSEVYSFFNEFDGFSTPEAYINRRHKEADIITYCRIIYDNGEINPAPMDCEGLVSASRNYVGYGSFVKNNPPYVFSGNANGNQTFNIISQPDQLATQSGRSTHFRILLDQSIYSLSAVSNQLNSDETENQKFMEPLYVVNLIREDADVVNLNTTQYKHTGHYIKLESLIGEGSGTAISYQLVSERWEDCVPRLSGQLNNVYQQLERFVYVENDAGVKQRWVNVTSKTNAQITTILDDIVNNGFHTVTDASGSYNVYGVYRHNQVQLGTHVQVQLVFDTFLSYPTNLMIPMVGKKVYVRYDNRIPVRVFGGDTWINESVWCPIDEEFNKNADHASGNENAFYWNIGMPFRGYKLPVSYQIMHTGESGQNNYIQNALVFQFQYTDKPASIRQWVCMWTAETRTNLSFFFNGIEKNTMDGAFPLMNYVMRPLKWRDNQFSNGAADVYDANRIHSAYIDDYGDEFLNWIYGGFRFKPLRNIDYSKWQSTQLITTTPEIGFEEQTDFCTRVLWSEYRPINAQYTPTVRTFPSSQYYDLTDDTGSIKFAWDGMSGDKGNNLYAFTNNGVALLLVDKRVIQEINGNELATSGSDIQGILNHLWIDKSIGMDDETWRSWAEYSNGLFFHNKVGVYMFSNNQLSSLTDNGWNEMYQLRIAPYIGDGYSTKLAGVYNILHKEYIMNFDYKNVSQELREKGIIPRSAIYGIAQEALQCRSTYNYEKYLSFNNKLYGMKDMTTFELGVGNQLNGADMQCYLVGVSDAEIYYDKEFIRIRVNSNSKPSKIEFFDDYEQYLDANPSSVVDADSSVVAIKNYHGYECYIPRKSVAPNFRQQGRLVIFKIVSVEDENFVISSTGVQYKVLK